MSSDSNDGSQKRPVRPNFAEDVYGEKDNSEEEQLELSDSSLAQRRQVPSDCFDETIGQVSLLKLKQLKEAVNTPGTSEPILPEPPSQVNEAEVEKDLNFIYTECDSILNELAELYSYSELDDFAVNYTCWKVYCDKNQVLLDIIHLTNQIDTAFHALPKEKQTSIVVDLIDKTESAEPDMRLSSSRTLLYILQGAFGEFAEEEEVEAGVQSQPPTDKGTGGYEADCIARGFEYAHMLYNCGAFPALCSLLLTEMVEPFDSGLLSFHDGRESKASSRESRHASNVDLSDHDKKQRAATLADNEALRVCLGCLYHMVELIRNKELTDGQSNSKYAKQREEFLHELGQPLDNYGRPLVYLLFELLPQFYTGYSPHFPIKKILLLIWKVLLATLGGFDELSAAKKEKRKARDLPSLEDTATTAGRLPATVIASEAENCVRMVTKRNLALARQIATAGSEEGKDDDDEFGQTLSKESEGAKRQNSRQTSGDRTPRAGSPMFEPQRKLLPWKPKVSKKEVEAFIQMERQKFFNYQLPGDVTTLFGFPPPILASIKILKAHIYTSIAELQAEEDANYNRYALSKKEIVEDNAVERLYVGLLPNLSQYVVALLKVLLASAPSNKAKNDALNILVDVLTPETDACDFLSNSFSLDNSTSNPLEDSVRITIDIKRHKEILVKAVSSILLLLCKHFKLNHIYQFEYLCQHVVFGNGIPLLLKFMDQNMQRYIQTRNEIYAYNYPQCVLHYVRNRDEWPTLNSENVEETLEKNEVYFLWRNMFSSLNLVRVLNKLVKGRHSRIMMLMVFKSAPILKRSLKVRSGIFQAYVLKVLKMQSRYLGRQWRRANMDIMSAIYSKVRHRLMDDWAFANEMRKHYDYHNEENELKAAVERFHSRRYSKLYPQLAIEVNDDPMPGDDYLNRVDLREYEPGDHCISSAIAKAPNVPPFLLTNHEDWAEMEVYRRNIDWQKVYLGSRGVYGVPENNPYIKRTDQVL